MRVIVWNENVLGIIQPNGLEVLRSNISKGGPFLTDPMIAFDPVLEKGKYRPATKEDFDNFRVAYHPNYGNASTCTERII